MTGLVSADRNDNYAVQFKIHQQKSHYKNNQLRQSTAINPKAKVTSVIDGKRVLFSG